MTTIDKINSLTGTGTRNLIKNAIRFLSKRYDATPDEIRGSRRFARLCWARWVGYFLLRRRGLTLESIGMAFGGKDHGTVHHGLTKAKYRAETCREHKLDLEEAVSAFESALPESIKTKFKWQEGE